MFLMDGSQPEDFNDRKAKQNEPDACRKLLEAEEGERKRLAGELREEVIEPLILCGVELAQIEGLLPNSPVEASKRTHELHEKAVELAGALQSVTHQLYPRLDYLSLAAAMRRVCKEFGEWHKLPVDFADADLPRTIQPEVSICLFRVLQEALDNVAKHSHAWAVEVRLEGKPDGLHLLIRDTGVGFDPEAAKGGGIGLVAMRERVPLVGGSISIASKPYFGTEISVRVPLQTHE